MSNHEVLPLTESKKPRFFYGHIVVIASSLMMLVIWGANLSFGIFFKPLVEDFGWTRAMTSGAMSVNNLTWGLLGMVMGRLTDRFGPRIVMTVSGFFLGLGYLLMSQTSTIWQLYLFFGVVVGIGMGGGFTPLLSTVARWFVKRRGLMTGIVVSGIGIGVVIMPPLASRIIVSYGWTTSYIIVGAITLVVVIIAAQFLKRDPSQKELLPYGADEVNVESQSIEEGLSLKEAIRTRQFWILCTLLLGHGFGSQAIYVHAVPNAIDLGIPPIIAANILAIIGGLFIIGTVVMGSIIDRMGSKRVLIIALSLEIIVLLWLSVAKEPWMLYFSAAIFGFGNGGVVSVESPIVAGSFGLRSHGAILGIVIFGFTIGSAAGPFVTGRIFDITGSYYLAFLLSAVLIVIGLILASLLRPSRKEVFR